MEELKKLGVVMLGNSANSLPKSSLAEATLLKCGAAAQGYRCEILDVDEALTFDVDKQGKRTEEISPQQGLGHVSDGEVPLKTARIES